MIQTFKEKHMDIDAILSAIGDERDRQTQLWGDAFDDKNTANDWVAYICHYVSEGAYDGRAGKYTPEHFRDNLMKAATLCVAAIQAIERNGQCAPRHYDKQ